MKVLFGLLSLFVVGQAHAQQPLILQPPAPPIVRKALSPGSKRLNLITSLLLSTELVGSAPAFAFDQLPSARNSPAGAVVSSLNGDIRVATADTTKEPRLVRFHDLLMDGDQLVTGPGSVADVLIGKHTLVTVSERALVRFLHDRSGQPLIQIMQGELRLAVSRHDQAVQVQIPTATGTTYGGLVYVNVRPGEQRVAPALPTATAHRQGTAVTPQGDGAMQRESIQVLEGRIHVHSPAAESVSITLEEGQGLEILGAQMGRPMATLTVPALSQPLAATKAHASTPARGLEQVVARSKAEAQALLEALLAAETPESQVDLKNVNVILSTSQGIPIPLAPQAQGTSSPTIHPAGLPPTPRLPDLADVILPTSFGVPVSSALTNSGPGSLNSGPGAIGLNNSGPGSVNSGPGSGTNNSGPGSFNSGSGPGLNNSGSGSLNSGRGSGR